MSSRELVVPGVVEAESRAEAYATVRSQQQLTRRVVVVYLAAALILLVAFLASIPLESQIFAHVPFRDGAPVLTIGATVAVGLHVAVYNLTHGQEGSEMNPQVLARLDLFSTAGVAVAFSVAVTGLLLLLPGGASDLGPARGLDVLGSTLSVVVVLVACMAGHIVPLSAVERVHRARREHNEAWLRRAADHWSRSGPVPPWSHVAFWALLVMPTLLVSVLSGGLNLRTVYGGASWSLLVVTPPALLVWAFSRVLHRRYEWAVLCGLAGLGLVGILAVLVAREFRPEWQWLALTACAALAWVTILRGAAQAPTSRRRPLIPRVVRALICNSLRSRLDRLTRSSPGPRRFLRWSDRWKDWFRRATGRVADPEAASGV